MPEGFFSAAALLPEVLRRPALALPEATRRRAEEVRLRRGFPPTLLLPEGERPFSGSVCGAEDISFVLEQATRCSLHAHVQELRRGYLAAPGGVRVGVCGTAVTEQGIVTLRDYSSLALRVPRQVIGAGAQAAETVFGESALIVSPPGGGKTTFLRELARFSSCRGRRVCVVDERGELAAAWEGAAQFDLGQCTDVLTGAGKSEGATLLLRAMNPEIVVMDELATQADAGAVLSLLGCGVRVCATAHGEGSAVLERPALRALGEARAFRFLVTIRGRGTGRRYAVEEL